MKKQFLALVLVLVLALGVTIPWGLALHADREAVEVTSTTLSGDPLAAQGLTITQTAQYDRRLLWEMAIPAHDPAGAVTQSAYHHRQVTADHQGSGLRLYLASSNTYFFHGDSSLDTLLEGSPELAPLEPILRDALDGAQAHRRYLSDVRLADYLDTYPLTADVDLGGYWYEENLSQALRDFFAFPIDPEEVWTVVVTANQAGDPDEISINAPGTVWFPSAVSVFSDTRLYFTFDRWSSTDRLDFSNTPGGFGLYAIDLGREDTAKVVLPDTIANVYPLPEEAVVLDLSWSWDQSALLLTYWLEDSYRCDVLDPETLDVLQSFPVPAEPPKPALVYYEDETGQEVTETTTHWGLNDVLVEETCLVFLGDEAFHLFSQEDGDYTYHFSAPTEDHQLLYPYEHLTAAWDGARLALASVAMDYEAATGLMLSVYEDGQLTYQGDYDTSLNDLVSPQAKENDRNYTGIYLLQDQELTLAWAGA